MECIKSLDPWNLPRMRLDQRDFFPETRGIYFAFKGSELLYVGKTIASFRSRWVKHHREIELINIGDVELAFWECNKDDETLLEIEKTAFSLFKPLLNGKKGERHLKAERVKWTIVSDTIVVYCKSHKEALFRMDNEYEYWSALAAENGVAVAYLRYPRAKMGYPVLASEV